MDDDYEPGQAEAERISYLIGHALIGHQGHTEALWRALASDTSDFDDEGRWLRQIATMVVGQILDRKGVPIEERARIALNLLGLGDLDDRNWQLKEDIFALDDFVDLTENPRPRAPTQIARDMKQRGHLPGISLRTATKVVTRILKKRKI